MQWRRVKEDSPASSFGPRESAQKLGMMGLAKSAPQGESSHASDEDEVGVAKEDDLAEAVEELWVVEVVGVVQDDRQYEEARHHLPRQPDAGRGEIDGAVRYDRDDEAQGDVDDGSRDEPRDGLQL